MPHFAQENSFGRSCLAACSCMLPCCVDAGFALPWASAKWWSNMCCLVKMVGQRGHWIGFVLGAVDKVDEVCWSGALDNGWDEPDEWVLAVANCWVDVASFAGELPSSIFLLWLNLQCLSKRFWCWNFEGQSGHCKSSGSWPASFGGWSGFLL